MVLFQVSSILAYIYAHYAHTKYLLRCIVSDLDLKINEKELLMSEKFQK